VSTEQQLEEDIGMSLVALLAEPINSQEVPIILIMKEYLHIFRPFNGISHYVYAIRRNDCLPSIGLTTGDYVYAVLCDER